MASCTAAHLNARSSVVFRVNFSSISAVFYSSHSLHMTSHGIVWYYLLSLALTGLPIITTLTGLPIFLTHGASLACFARSRSAKKKAKAGSHRFKTTFYHIQGLGKCNKVLGSVTKSTNTRSIILHK